MDTAAFAHRLAEEEFDLGVEAAKVVLGPAREMIHQLNGQAQEIRFPLRHDCHPARSLDHKDRRLETND